MSFDKILIANRGEIACRIIETCDRLGVATVAVFSDADKNARHVAMAGQAVRIGHAPVTESYLRGDVIIEAARATGAQALHPGYGFLSENPEFAQSVLDAGLRWIGPSPDAMRAMGLKDAAKALMADAGVPVVPGYHGADQDDAHLAREAVAIGFPVLIKAVAGGGGKGMRLVEEAGGFAEALASARSEAQAAFGNGDVLVEKFIQNPRHIEVQVFGDSHGGAVHLFERDCSLQRRHQKVIEEAPAPGMTAEVREAMGSAAVRAAQAIDYAGAGTVEFIVDGKGPLRTDGFWFMEMNTRLQVEHPVTEMITGVDLVEWQLQVASGAPLPLAQDELSINGHSFEARIYAEDVAKGFLPATGTLTHLHFPAGARADTGVRAGDTITPYYDPMIAKLITHGPDRTAALSQMVQALAATEVAGSVTNLAFLGALARHEGFARGEVDTGLIGRDLDDLTKVVPVETWEIALAAVALANLGAPAFTQWTPLRRTIWVDGGGDQWPVALTAGKDGWIANVGEAAHLLTYDAGWIVDGNRPLGRVASTPGGVSIFGKQTRHFTPHDLLDIAASYKFDLESASSELGDRGLSA
ncbi:MAG: biotin carboxylase N-terminal domain-containing protein [Pseudomonadota bacterium]